jgi:copper transport protein
MTIHDRGGVRAALGAAAVLLALLYAQPEAFAHARLLRSQPGAGAALKQAPKIVELWFSEELDAGGCAVAVTDQTGRRVDKQNIGLAEGGKKLQAELDDMASGAYTVEWKVLSTDGHTMKGKFTFTLSLDEAAAAAPSTTPPGSQAAAQPTQGQPWAAQPTSEGMQESGTPWTMSLVRWLEYLAMMTLAGGFAFRLLILGPVLRWARGLEDGERETSLSAGTRQFVRLSGWALSLLALTTFAALVLQTSAVTDSGFAEALSPARLYRVLTRTNYGGPWLLQAAAVVALAFVLFLMAKRIGVKTDERHPANTSNHGLLWAGVIVSALMMLAPSLTGHARAAAAAEYRLTVFSDWLHLVAAGFGLGGLFHLALTMTRGVSGLEAGKRLRVLERAIPLFTRLAVVCTVVIALTGVYNSWIHVDRLSALWGTPYGEALLVKIILFVVMVALGGVSTFVIHPRAKRLIEGDDGAATDEHLKLDRSFYRAVGLEAALGILVLLAAAVLVFLQPVREHRMNMTRAAWPDSTVVSDRR